jgi:hypothetical protein
MICKAYKADKLSGRADFLCMQADGTISGYLNKGVGNMVSQGVIKHAEGRERKSEL